MPPSFMKDKRHGLIDGDVLVYRSALAAEYNQYYVHWGDAVHGPFRYKGEATSFIKEEADVAECEIVKERVVEDRANALHNVSTVIKKIVNDLLLDSYDIFLTGAGNFREEIYPEYKANRDRDERPVHYKAVRDYLVKQYGAVVVEGIEADDAMAMNQTENSVICTVDKDLDMVPGWHHNWTKEKDEDRYYHVSELNGMRFFYEQLITGDPTDNIIGLSEKAPKRRTFKTAPLDEMETEQEMFEYVSEGYKAKYEDDWEEQMLLNGQLLWMMREEDKLWKIPHFSTKS